MQLLIQSITLIIVIPISWQKHVSSVTRHYRGDLFVLSESYTRDSYDSCPCTVGSSRVGSPGECQCQCNSNTPTFREDTMTCTDDLNECLLAEFVSLTDIDKIPYVYIPLQHELIHPTAEIALLGLTQEDTPLVSPACVATTSHVLMQTGWKELGNATTFETPFRLHRDFGRTYLQWTGTEIDKDIVTSKLILVNLLCRDSAFPEKPLFNPCVALRVAGSSGIEKRIGHAVMPEDVISDQGLTLKESLILGLVLGFLFVAYIVGSIVYVRYRRRNTQSSSKIMEEGSAVPIKSTKVSTMPHGVRRSKRFPKKTSLVSSEDDSEFEDIEDLSAINKGRSSENTADDVAFTTAVVHEPYNQEDIYSVASEAEEMEGRRQRMERIKLELETRNYKRQQADKLLEQQLNGNCKSELEFCPLDFQFPAIESVATGAKVIGVVSPPTEPQVEDMIVSQNKKKLYFNPSYLERSQLKNPPPGAIEFVSKIREMMHVAKTKLKAKSFKPTLIPIPENDHFEMPRTPSSMSTSRPSSCLTFTVDEIEDQLKEGKGGFSENPQTTSWSISSMQDTPDMSTLKRLAKRVNTHGETLVSELVRTLDIKPQVPHSFYLPPTVNGLINPSFPKQNAVDRPKKGLGETVFPDLIKPSLVKETVNQLDHDRTDQFDTVTEEMRMTLSKAQEVHRRTPATGRKNALSLKESHHLPQDDNEKRKVHNWLESLEMKHKQSVTKHSTSSLSTIEKTVDEMVQNEVVPGLYTASMKGGLLNPSEPLVMASQSRTERLAKCDPVAAILEDANDKLPKLTSSDSESNTYDSLSKFKKCNNSRTSTGKVQTVSNEMSVKDDIDVRNNSVGSLKHCSSDTDDHAYEEIQFSINNSRHKPKKLTKEHIQEIQVFAEETDDEGRCSIYSNPESLISEVHISDEQMLTKHSNRSILSIEVNRSGSDSDECTNPTSDNNQRKRRKVKRNDSIIQDSLERPKMKKKQNPPNETSNDNKFVSSSNEAKTDDPKVKRNKTLRTFKDYHDMKFFRQNNSTLSVVDGGINLNFLHSTSKNIEGPPLPPKLLKSMEDIPSLLKSTSNADHTDISAPSIPPKFKLNKSKSFAEHTSLHYHVVDIPLLPPKVKPKTFQEPVTSEQFPQLPPKVKKALSVYDVQDAPPKLPEKGKKRSSDPNGLEKSNINSKENNSNVTDQLNLKAAYDENSKQTVEGDIPAQSSCEVTDAIMNLSKNKNESSFFDDANVNSTSTLRKKERVRGEFILSTNRTPSLRRQNSLPKNGTLLSAVQKVVADLDGDDKNALTKLESKIKGNLEQHFKEKSDADNIKKTWAFIMEKLENSDHKLQIHELQKYLTQLETLDCETKNKQDDSGYQSTDSSDSNKLIHHKFRNLEKGTLLKNSIQDATNDFRNRSSHKQAFLQKSHSSHHILTDAHSSKFHSLRRNSSTNSIKEMAAPNRLSVYINDKHL